MKTLLGLLVQSIIVIFLFCAANAENESTFKEKGYGAFSIKGPEQTGCFTVEFLREEFPLLNEKGSHLIVSINATFKPEMHGTASIDFFINNEFIGRKELSDFVCSAGECWTRMEIPKELLEKDNRIKICGKTGKSITGIEISSDSLIGAYLMPIINSRGFKKCIYTDKGACTTKYNAKLGEDLNVNIIIHNSGSREAFVRFRDKRAIIKDREERKELGDVDFNFLLPAGSTKRISYQIRVKELGKMSLVPSVIYYDNVFGEEQSILSNVVDVEVFSVKPTVNVFIVGKDNEKRTAKVKIVVSNNSPYPLRELFLSAIPGKGVTINGPDKLELPVLNAKSSESLEFTVSANDPGEYSIGCIAIYGNSKNTIECEKAVVLFVEKAPDTIAMGAGLMLVIGVLIYIHLNTRKEYK